MRMCGTVKFMPTLTYRVHFDSINISDWTDYKRLLQREIGSMLFEGWTNVCDVGRH